MHGQDTSAFAYGMWSVVAFNVLLFLFFAISFVRPKGRVEWRTMGVFIGFIVALFTEMYGLPLTIYFLTQWLGASYPVLNPFSHNHGHLWLVMLRLADSSVAMTILHLLSNGIMFFGFYVLYKGWTLIYHSEGRLVTEGVYSHVRHPQYVGLFLITLGLLIQWPTLITLVMWPILVFAYYRLSMREEKEVSRHFPAEYAAYRRHVPAFIPRLLKHPKEHTA
ncbi:MAG TPA: isoprenylcysteine carboxylmethyltransferase family protein [Chthoniobacterales bacterium]